RGAGRQAPRAQPAAAQPAAAQLVGDRPAAAAAAAADECARLEQRLLESLRAAAAPLLPHRDRPRAARRTAPAACLQADSAPSAPGGADHCNSLGVALFRTGDLAGARANFERALALDPGHRDARANLADLPVA